MLRRCTASGACERIKYVPAIAASSHSPCGTSSSIGTPRCVSSVAIAIRSERLESFLITSSGTSSTSLREFALYMSFRMRCVTPAADAHAKTAYPLPATANHTPRTGGRNLRPFSMNGIEPSYMSPCCSCSRVITSTSLPTFCATSSRSVSSTTSVAPGGTLSKRATLENTGALSSATGTHASRACSVFECHPMWTGQSVFGATHLPSAPFFTSPSQPSTHASPFGVSRCSGLFFVQVYITAMPPVVDPVASTFLMSSQSSISSSAARRPCTMSLAM
mmetsp:Transcript_8962/g.26329  ORF Transcript_8962/g.26329 Transcript_8962/m.26329 type:complete len:277 (-) Transcript_8962:322-1152(-)